jgi:hypothetical protein
MAPNRKWWEQLREDNPEFYARLFQDCTPEKFDDVCVAQGIPSACDDEATLRRVARILETQLPPH